MRLNLLLLFSLFLFVSCAKTKEEEIDIAIDVMQTLLSEGKCQEAIDVAEAVGRQNDNPIFIQVHASAYMCRGGFSEITFIDQDIDKIDTTATGFMPSLTTLSTSNETAADSQKYQDLRTALDLLLNVTSGQPSQVDRNAKFGVRKAGDMAVQALMIQLAQLGKFLKYYGNTDVNGAKGNGSNVNDCFVAYTHNFSQAYLNDNSNPGGACDDTTTDLGHPDLDFAPAATLTITKRRMCEGLMLVTNILDVVNGVDLSSNDSVAALESIVQIVNDYRDFVITQSGQLATLLNTTSQTACESNVATATEFDNLQYIYALLFEKGLL